MMTMDTFTIVVITFVVVLLFRTFWLWFWRIDHAIKRLDTIAANQDEQSELLRSLIAQNRTIIDLHRNSLERSPAVGDNGLPVSGVSGRIDAMP